MILHTASYPQILEAYHKDYQASAQFQATLPACPQGQYYSVKLQSCQQVPPAPGSNEAYFLLFQMLAWVAAFRTVTTFFGLLFNSKILMITAHAVKNTVYVAFVVLGGTLVQKIVYVAAGFLGIVILIVIWTTIVPAEEKETEQLPLLKFEGT